MYMYNMYRYYGPYHLPYMYISLSFVQRLSVNNMRHDTRVKNVYY